MTSSVHKLQSTKLYKVAAFSTNWCEVLLLHKSQYLNKDTKEREKVSSLTCLQIIEFYVWIQDKTEVLQSSHSRLNSGENISKQFEIICFSWIFNFIALFIFHKPYFISLCDS